MKEHNFKKLIDYYFYDVIIRVQGDLNMCTLLVAMSTGVLSDMKQFFDDLRNNMDSLDSLGQEERDALLGKSTTVAGKQTLFDKK